MHDHPLSTQKEDDAFLTRLREPPRPAFTAALFERLASQGDQPVSALGPWPGPLAWLGTARARVMAAALVIALALALSVALALPAVARTWLAQVAPREVTAIPTPVSVTDAPTPAGRRWETLAQLQAEVGFAPLVPAYLPAGCSARERFSIPGPKAAILTYSCVTISEQAPRGEQTERPYVGPGATEEVYVGDTPATYIRGIWVVDAQGRQTWDADASQQLVLERGGLIIWMTAGSGVPKAELIHIAASLQPAK
ncbi:MAG TPA: hypothetical protein VFW96_24185 [Thermomicrobiales bacterium]|nr:hypothetical protein [Thermomicrobiales bacterium]